MPATQFIDNGVVRILLHKEQSITLAEIHDSAQIFFQANGFAPLTQEQLEKVEVWFEKEPIWRWRLLFGKRRTIICLQLEE